MPSHSELHSLHSSPAPQTLEVGLGERTRRFPRQSFSPGLVALAVALGMLRPLAPREAPGADPAQRSSSSSSGAVQRPAVPARCRSESSQGVTGTTGREAQRRFCSRGGAGAQPGGRSGPSGATAAGKTLVSGAELGLSGQLTAGSGGTSEESPGPGDCRPRAPRGAPRLPPRPPLRPPGTPRGAAGPRLPQDFRRKPGGDPQRPAAPRTGPGAEPGPAGAARGSPAAPLGAAASL